MHLISILLLATKLEWKSALKKWGIMSLQKTKSVYARSEQQYITAGRKVQVPWGGIHEWLKTEQEDCNMDWWSKCSSVSALSLCGHKTRALKTLQSCQFWIILCSFLLIHNYDYECYAITKRVLSQAQAAEIGFLLIVHSVTLHDKVCSCWIPKALNVESLLHIVRCIPLMLA